VEADERVTSYDPVLKYDADAVLKFAVELTTECHDTTPGRGAAVV
jgi:hypothetical protein